MRRSPMPPRRTRLKDTPLERHTRLRAPGTPARTDRGTRRSWNSTLPASRKPMKAKGGSRFPKQRQPDYTRWIRSLPCTVANGECWGPIDPAHVNKTRAQGAPDLGEVVPLCRNRHHREQEGQTARFNQKYGVNLAVIAARLATTYQGGRVRTEHLIAQSRRLAQEIEAGAYQITPTMHSGGATMQEVLEFTITALCDELERLAARSAVPSRG